MRKLLYIKWISLFVVWLLMIAIFMFSIIGLSRSMLPVLEGVLMLVMSGVSILIPFWVVLNITD